ncbi:preprotein translocase subunit SecG [Allopseudospirillum japonicum]|uniref:Protein-export membrane protein SecG n=1 Tax=Allopseudospirillum japonicum TaxID=64971 RepID=A0A1H6QRM3_9GAMM|nr:preprotein translocase subunit SecG [Allopseudospirillum japonicum]SEI44656.1 preprotein translocase subunit SecG [Allopseudospirillum japonicum]
METLILVTHAALSLALIVLVLLQQGKGAEAGASFGGGASQTVFGSRGNASFLSRLTSILAAIFFVTSIGLAYIAKERFEAENQSLISDEVVEEFNSALPVLDEAATPATSPAQALPTLESQPEVDNSQAETTIDTPQASAEPVTADVPGASDVPEAVDQTSTQEEAAQPTAPATE